MRKLRLKESLCSILSCCSGLSNHTDVTKSHKEKYLVSQSCPQDILGTVQPLLSSLFPLRLLVSTSFSLFVAGPCISQTLTHLFQGMTDLVPPLEPSCSSSFISFCFVLLVSSQPSTFNWFSLTLVSWGEPLFIQPPALTLELAFVFRS